MKENSQSLNLAWILPEIYEIEEQQIQQGVGIVVRGPALEGDEGKRFVEEIADKKHTPSLAKLLRGNCPK